MAKEISKFRVLQILEAMDAIEEKGIMGLGEATLCAGEGVAMVLLVNHLRERFRREGPQAVTKDAEQLRLCEAVFRTIEVGRLTEFTTWAKVDMTCSRAIVMGQNGNVFLLEHDKPGVLTNAEGMNISMLFDGCSVTKAIAGPPPYDDLFRFLRFNAQHKVAWDLVGIIFDPTTSDDLRREAVGDLNEIFADKLVGKGVENQIVGTTLETTRVKMMSVRGPFKGRFGELFAEALVRAGE